MKKIGAMTLQHESDGVIRVTRTIEHEEELSVDQIHAKIKSEQLNKEMYEKLAEQASENIRRYREILAAYYSAELEASKP